MRRSTAQRGQAIVLIALMMAVLVGFVALAIDSGRAFDARRVLQDATDAAALAGATSYQAGHGWSTSETDLLQIFEKDLRVGPGELCSPSAFAIPAAGGTATVTCNLAAAAGYQLTITASDGGPTGQTFSLLARRPLVVALMQVLGGVTSLTIQAAGAATANELGRTPALGGLSYDNSCAGGTGATTTVHIENKTNLATITGDIVSNGSLTIGGLSFIHLAGNVLTRCAAPVNPDHITYECWKSGATQPCSGSDVAGQVLSTANRLADPGYLPPAHPSGNQGIPGTTVELAPGIYTANPNFGSNGPCYFLSAGVYEWQGGLSVNSGEVSNELKPPGEAASPQFWQHSHCGGDFHLSSIPGTPPAPGPGSYSVVLTSIRTDLVNGTPFVRQSAPSRCQSITVDASHSIQLVVSNVPGARSYDVYAAANNTCTPPFNLLSLTIPAGAGNNLNVSSCPDAVNTPQVNCTLGQGSGTYDGSITVNNGLHPPDPETAQFAGLPGLPGQNAARASLPGGDLANENHCATTLGASVACPALGTANVTTNFVTPGAVVMYVNSSTCLNLTGGDAFLFSGYQYDWLLNYEPPSTACTNNWNGVFNSAAIGMSYTPSSAFNISGDTDSNNNTWSLEAPMGGIVAATIHIGYSSGLVIDWDQNYAPVPGGPRLTG